MVKKMTDRVLAAPRGHRGDYVYYPI